MGLQRDREQGADRRRAQPRGCTATPASSWRRACRSRSGAPAYILGCWARARRGRAAAHAPRGARRSACLLRRAGRRGRPLDPPGRGGPARPAALGMTAMRLSAAVCTRDRPILLQRALDSLLRQTVPPAEILVVDNAPGNGAVRALVASRFPAVRYVAEPVPGLDFARNRALVEARDEVVAFLDDDAVADVDWAGALLHVFQTEPRVAVCTGRVEPLGLNTPGERLFEANGGFSRGLERIVLPDRCRPSPARASGAAHRLGGQRRERVQLRRPPRACARAGRIRRSARPRDAIAGGRRSRPALAGSPGRALGGVRAARRSPGTSTGPRPPRRATRSSATSARCSPSWPSTWWRTDVGGRRSLGTTGVAARQARRAPAATSTRTRSAAGPGAAADVVELLGRD